MLLLSFIYRRQKKEVTKKEKPLFSLRGIAAAKPPHKGSIDESAHQLN